MNESPNYKYYIIHMPEEMHYHIRGNLIFINSVHYASLDNWLKQFLGSEALPA